jgi:hypothetical protein
MHHTPGPSTWTLLLAAVALLAVGPHAQPLARGSCEAGRAQAALDVSDVRVMTELGSSLFDPGTYEVPVDSPRSPLYSTSLWIGGVVQGQVRTSGGLWGHDGLWPGPIDPEVWPPESCALFDRVWSVRRADIERYYRTGITTTDLAEWPWQLGAPVLDGDGDPTNYDLVGGDEPAIRGDQSVWWIANDAGAAPLSNEWSPPLGVEVRATTFAVQGSQVPAVRSATFYQLSFTNRGTETLDSVHVGLFIDTEIGSFDDDFFGSDTSLALVYTYNRDDDDPVLGASTPAFGFSVLKGPVALADGRDNDSDGAVDEPAERASLTASSYFVDDWPGRAFPYRPRGIFDRLRGLWTDGEVITAYGDGYQTSGEPTTLVFPGNPVAGQFWSGLNTDGSGTPLPPWMNTHMFMLSTGPFRLPPDSQEEILIAFIYAKGADFLDSVAELRRAAHIIRLHHDEGLLDPVRVRPSPSTQAPVVSEVHRPAPNPFADDTRIRVVLPRPAHVRITLIDLLGRDVAVIADAERETGVHDFVVRGARLPGGTYIARVWIAGQSADAFPLTRR